MLRFLLRAGLIHVVGRRAVPALMVIDVALLANRARQIPVVDRSLRRGAAAVADQVASTLERWPAPGGKDRGEDGPNSRASGARSNGANPDRAGDPGA